MLTRPRATRPRPRPGLTRPRQRPEFTKSVLDLVRTFGEFKLLY